MLLNVGPDAYGNIPPESLQILSEIGAWMKKNSKSVYGCGMAGIEKPDYGRVTRNGNLLYYHMFENTMGPVPLTGIKPGTIKKIRLYVMEVRYRFLTAGFIPITQISCLQILDQIQFCQMQ